MSEFFNQLLEKVNLEEGVEGIRQILLQIYRNGSISVKKLSRLTLIPVPLVSKIVNVLSEQKLLSRSKNGIQYWEHGMKFVEKEFGFFGYGTQKCPTCKSRPVYVSPMFDEMFEILNSIFAKRPSVDTTLDQSKNTVETAIQRACYLYEKGALEGKRVLFIGDDDFTSVCVGMMSKIFFPNDPFILIPKSITVIDIDARIVESIQTIFRNNKLTIQCIQYDLREPIPSELLHSFDTIITDPPYSPDGLGLFLSRALSCMDSGVNKDIFLSFAHRSPDQTMKIQSIMTQMGLSIVEIIPRFNKYEGSETLGNETQMFHLKTTSFSQELVLASAKADLKIYTGETHPYIRQFQCMSCNAIIEVGPDKEYQTIEELKGATCPNCSSKKFKLIGRNLILH
ncbi:MAG: bis-aminopropyl spermidine synthase family protein [Candidatus Lokiarchaeota archaeon]|nr:bis-aminopropyl spermidine synthase family protein [Candidatus Lokiarchaeota archaeon]